MKRWHEEAARMKTRRKEMVHWVARPAIGDDRSVPERFKQDGRYRKKKPLDCGKTQCLICHSDKFPIRERTKQEILSEVSFREQLHGD